MSTSCLICCGESINNTIYCARCQYDGYPSYVGKILKTTRDTYKKALEISKNGNFFELTEDGEPNRIDTGYNHGQSYEIDYCTPKRLVDIIINSDEFLEIDFIYYFSEHSNEWICFNSSGRRIRNENNQRRVKNVKQNKFEMGVRADRTVSPLKYNKQERQKLLKDLNKLQSQIESSLATVDNYNSLLSTIAGDFYSEYIQATDVQQLELDDDIKQFIENKFGDLIDDSYIKNNKIWFEIYIELNDKLNLISKHILEDAFGLSHYEKINSEIFIIDDTTVCVVVRINR